MVIAYSARGASGFGAAAAMPLLGLVLPLKVLVPAWTLIALVAGTALIGSDRKQDRLAASCCELVPGTLIGIARRALRLHAARSSDALAKWLGGFVLLLRALFAVGTFGARRRPICRRGSPRSSAASAAA